MLDNNNINIGGVRFNKNDVQKSEVIKQDGKEMNSVFLNDGTSCISKPKSWKWCKHYAKKRYKIWMSTK